MKDIEVRMLQNKPSVLEGRRIEGCAIKFNSRSVDLGFYEIVKPEACTQEFIDRQDVLALFDHNSERGILARSNKGIGNLKLEVRDDGLYYSFDALNTPLGNEVLEYIKNGIIEGSSFAFVVDSENGGETWERNADGTILRTIRKFSMIADVSCVVHPAYPATTCSCRSLDNFIEKEKREKEQEELEKEYQEWTEKIEKLEE